MKLEIYQYSADSGWDTNPDTSSCVGRRLVIGPRTEEGIDAALSGLPRGTEQTDFYSCAEISPLASGKCDLHNQTMTLTLIWENT